jgi:hypothetical protein
LLKPRWSSYWWGQRLDRQAMSRWLQQVRQRGYPNLDDRLALLKMYEPIKRNYAVLFLYQEVVLHRETIPSLIGKLVF